MDKTLERHLEAGLGLIESRRTVLEQLRNDAITPHMHAVLETFVAKLAGRVDFQVEGNPDRVELADAVFTTAWRKFVQPFVEAALLDYAVAGFGGLFVSPFGVRRLKPEEATWLGEMLSPVGHVRKFSMPYADARKRYGNHWQEDDPEAIVYIAEVYLQYDATLYHVALTGERNVLRKWEHYPYDAHWLFGTERPANHELAQTLLPVSLVEMSKGYIDVQENIRQAAQFRMKRARLAQLNVSSLVDADALDALSSAYRLVPSATPNPLIIPLDEVSPAEIQMFSELAERKIASLTGVGLYDQNVLPDTKTATESVYYVQLGSARAQYIMEKVRQWIGSVVQDYRKWLIRLPDDEVPFFRVHVGDAEETFGAHRHVREALEGMRVVIAGSGWDDILTRRQRAEVLLQLAAVVPQMFNMRAVLEESVRSLNADPSLYLVPLP
jgi:hypothetical protein